MYIYIYIISLSLYTNVKFSSLNIPRCVFPSQRVSPNGKSRVYYCFNLQSSSERTVLFTRLQRKGERNRPVFFLLLFFFFFCLRILTLCLLLPSVCYIFTLMCVSRYASHVCVCMCESVINTRVCISMRARLV